MAQSLFQCFLAVLLLACFGWIACQPNDRVQLLEDEATEGQAHFLADRLWVDLDMQSSYDQIAQLKFCFDFNSKEEVLQLLRETLPADELSETYAPDPEGDVGALQEDEICSSWDNMAPYICHTEEEYTLYFQVRTLFLKL